MRGIFASYRGFLAGFGGGVQKCTHEYVETIQAAGVELEMFPFDSDRRFVTRLIRLGYSSPYFRPAGPDFIDRLVNLANGKQIDFIFLNQVALAVYASEIKSRLPGIKIVLLSHGLESTDLLNLVRLKQILPLSGRVRPTIKLALGSVLDSECKSRPDIDLVYTLSPFDAELERWIGARRVTVLPRVITSDPLDWRPIGRHLGYLGTLDHAPNLEGIVRLCEAFSAAQTVNYRMRIIGGTKHLGDWLTKRFPQIDYLGRLTDSEVRLEAATWNAFLNPIFCQARGCSTKLATAIQWEIPIVTTAFGCRGYTWRSGSMKIADDPHSFALEAKQLLDQAAAKSAQLEVSRLALFSPNVSDISILIKNSLIDIS